VRALARETSLARVPEGAEAVIGDALDADSVAAALRPGDTAVHLVGTPHPTPAKAKQFEEIDLASIRATVNAARRGHRPSRVCERGAADAGDARIFGFVGGETMIKEAGFGDDSAAVVCPRPGHRWPIVLLPFYKIAKCFPSTRDSAERLGLVMIDQVASALVHVVENPPDGGKIRILDVPAIRRTSK
jgi:nucleoside-diphosphate-sugar epimerase